MEVASARYCMSLRESAKRELVHRHKLRGKPKSFETTPVAGRHRSQQESNSRSPDSPSTHAIGEGWRKHYILGLCPANPYYPSHQKTLDGADRVKTHDQRPPSVRRHRRPVLPNRSRVTARALPRTDDWKCSSRQHGSLTSTYCPSALSSSYTSGTTRNARTSPHCLAGNIAQKQRWLPPTPLPTFYSGHTPPLRRLKHLDDQVQAPVTNRQP